MSDPIDLASHRESRQPHISGTAVCMRCGHTWVAVMPYEHRDDTQCLTCPNCSANRGVLDNNFSYGKGRTVFNCKCNGQLFQIDDSGNALCIVCGAEHQPFGREK